MSSTFRTRDQLITYLMNVRHHNCLSVIVKIELGWTQNFICDKILNAESRLNKVEEKYEVFFYEIF